MNKFNIGEVVYVKVAYGQNQNVIGCGLVTDIDHITLSTTDYYQYNIKFIDSDGKTLIDFLMDESGNDRIDEEDIYKLYDFTRLLDDLKLNLDLQRKLTEAKEK